MTMNCVTSQGKIFHNFSWDKEKHKVMPNMRCDCGQIKFKNGQYFGKDMRHIVGKPKKEEGSKEEANVSGA